MSLAGAGTGNQFAAGGAATTVIDNYIPIR